jgi:hypothetical protein
MRPLSSNVVDYSIDIIASSSQQPTEMGHHHSPYGHSISTGMMLLFPFFLQGHLVVSPSTKGRVTGQHPYFVLQLQRSILFHWWEIG